MQVKHAYDERWKKGHTVLHSIAFALDPEYLYVDMSKNPEVALDVIKYIDIYHGKGTLKAVKAAAQYGTFRACQGIFARETVRAAAAHMPAHLWWNTWGGTVEELKEIAVRVLAQPVGAGAGERNWSTYSFIVDKRRNRLSVDRARKLVFVHFNVRLLRKVHAVDYEAEYFAWEVEEEEAEEVADAVEVLDEQQASKNSDFMSSESDSESH